MARVRPHDGLQRLIDAAARVFTRKGYKRTQMADVAAEMGVSQGTLYGYVESKEALFYLVIDRLDGPALDGNPPLPISNPPPGALHKRLRERLKTAGQFPQLDAALKRRRVTDGRAELETVVRELYRLIERTARAASLVERSAADIPELGRVFFVEFRRGLIEKLTRYLARRMASGRFRKMPDPAAAARVVIESAAWSARHRHGDPDSAMIDDDIARETVVHFVVNALSAT